MKITSLTESNTPSSSTANTTNSAPKFGRSDKFLEEKDETVEESTTAGSVASVASPVGKVQSRGSMLAGIKTSAKYPNSKAVKESQINEVDPRNFDSDEDYYAARNAPAKARSHARQSPGVNPDDEAYFREIFRKKRLAAQQAERNADHDRLATGTNEGEEMGTFAALKDWQVWDVRVFNNFYAGKYADYGPRLYSVVASSPEEARQVVINNPDYVLQDLLARKLQNGKRVLPRGSALPIEEKRVGKADPGTITTMGFKEMLTPKGPMKLKFASGKIVGSEDGEVDEGMFGFGSSSKPAQQQRKPLDYGAVRQMSQQTGPTRKFYQHPEEYRKVHGEFDEASVPSGMTWPDASIGPTIKANKIYYADHVVILDPAIYNSDPALYDKYVRDIAGEDLDPQGDAKYHKYELDRINNDGSWTVRKLKPKGVTESATPASVSKVLRLIQRHNSDWFDTYGLGEVEDTVVDMADMDKFYGLSAADAMALVGQELESLYGQQGVAEGSKQKCSCHPGDADPDCPVHGLEPMDVGDALDVKLDEKSKSQAQFRTMAAVAHNPKFAKKVGISQKVGKEFHSADRKQDYKDLPKEVDEASFDYTTKDLGNDYAGFPSNHSLKHKFLARIKPEKQQLYKDKMNNMHEFDQLFQLFTVAKQRGDIIDEGVADTVKQKAKQFSKYMTEPDTPQQAVVRDRAKNIDKIRKNKEQGVAEDFNPEYDDEAGSAEGNLHTIARAAQGLIDSIGDNENLPEWAQEKIAKVEGMLVAVWDYLESQEEQGIDPQVDEDWQKANKSDKTDGMSPKAVKAYRRENPGSKLKTAVTTKPSKLKAGSKDANRRKSFCARMSGNKGPMKDEKGRPTPKAKALSRWNCESVEQTVQMLESVQRDLSEVKQRLDPKCWKGYKKQGTKMKGDTRVNNCVPVSEAEFNEDKLAQDLYNDLQIFKKGADKEIGSKAKDKEISSKAKDKEIQKKK